MNRTAVATILQRDLRVVARSRAVSLPILLLPVVFFVLAPALLTLGAAAIGNDVAEFEELLGMMPEAFRRDVVGLDPLGLAVDGAEVHPLRAQRDLQRRDLGIGTARGERRGSGDGGERGNSRDDGDTETHGTDNLGTSRAAPAFLYKSIMRRSRSSPSGRR